MLVIRQRIEARPEWQAELELTYDARSKSRLRCFSTSGEDVGLFLERGQPPLHDGECLLAGDGRAEREWRYGAERRHAQVGVVALSLSLL